MRTKLEPKGWVGHEPGLLSPVTLPSLPQASLPLSGSSCLLLCVLARCSLHYGPFSRGLHLFVCPSCPRPWASGRQSHFLFTFVSLYPVHGAQWVPDQSAWDLVPGSCSSLPSTSPSPEPTPYIPEPFSSQTFLGCSTPRILFCYSVPKLTPAFRRLLLWCPIAFTPQGAARVTLFIPQNTEWQTNSIY